VDVIRILLSVLIPPLGVFLQVGVGMHFWINIVLTLLGYFPGLVHAIYIIVTRPQRELDRSRRGVRHAA
jgi:uncharacterized membrane protein YqaE (UPF0057 family)